MPYTCQPRAMRGMSGTGERKGGERGVRWREGRERCWRTLYIASSHGRVSGQGSFRRISVVWSAPPFSKQRVIDGRGLRGGVASDSAGLARSSRRSPPPQPIRAPGAEARTARHFQAERSCSVTRPAVSHEHRRPQPRPHILLACYAGQSLQVTCRRLQTLRRPRGSHENTEHTRVRSVLS